MLSTSSLTYISGPPCSGKSVACDGLCANFPALEWIVGDRYWNQNEGLAFDERVAVTNEMILKDLGKRTAPHLLLEWVPASDPFRSKLRKICKSQNRSFNHIVLWAEPDALRTRKLARDGDEDLFLPDLEHLKHLKEALVLDTTRLSECEVQTKCLEWLSTRLCQAVRGQEKSD